MGLPHYVTEDDEYKGHFIPKGTTVLPNTWYTSLRLWCLFTTLTPFDRAILHDSTAYPDPLAFKPQRFEDPEASRRNNPLPNAAFGYGRRYDCIFTWNVSPYIDALNRMCPGRWLAWDSIWIAVASILKVYNISPIAPDLLVRYFDSNNTYSRFSPY